MGDFPVVLLKYFHLSIYLSIYLQTLTIHTTHRERKQSIKEEENSKMKTKTPFEEKGNDLRRTEREKRRENE